MNYPDGTPVNPGDTVTAALPIKWITDKVYPPQQRTCTVRNVYEKSILVDYPLTFMGSPILQSSYLVAGEFTKVPKPLSATPKGAPMPQTFQVTQIFTVGPAPIVATLNPTAPPEFTVGKAIAPYPIFASVVGGVPPFSYSFDASTPFPGMSIDANGVLTGTPTQIVPAGTAFKINGKDSSA